jgi:enoyl-CoA hydratase/carnithine racemase
VTVEVITPQTWFGELASVTPRWSPLDGPTAVVVDGDWDVGVAPGGDARRPPVPVIARVRGPLGADAVPLADACDVVVGQSGEEAPGAVAGGDDAVTLIAGRVAANPLAASVLCQLLRGSGDLDVAAGLLAESLAYATLQAGPEFRVWLADRPTVTALPPADPSPAVVLDRVDDVLSVRLDRAEVHNAVDVDMSRGLVEAFDLVASDPSILTVHLSGAGASFCSGGDLREFGTTPDPATGHAVRSLRLPARSLARVADRVHATVRGASVGAGVELAAFAWAVDAHRDATFRLPEIAMGLVPGAGGTVSLPRRIGRHRTAWLALSGTAVDAPTALVWGLVDRVLD